MRFLLVIKLNLFKLSYAWPTNGVRVNGRVGVASCVPVLAWVTLVFGNNVAVRQPQDSSMGLQFQVLCYETHQNER